MAYTPVPSDVTQPADSVPAGAAAAEFRALKAYIAGLAFGTPGVPLTVGTCRNLVISRTGTAVKTFTMTADQVTVGVGLTGAAWSLGNLSKSIDVATVGAGGMDVGASPNQGFLAIYLIYNASTFTSALLAKDVSVGTNGSVLAPETYGGANMPSGYTASALISVLRTDGSGNFMPFRQQDRTIMLAAAKEVMFTSTLNSGSFLAVTLGGAVPLNAKRLGGQVYMAAVASTQSWGSIVITSTDAVFAAQGASSIILVGNVPFAGGINNGISINYSEYAIFGVVNLFANLTNSAASNGAINFGMNVAKYTI